jgi:hypothetical protein
MTISLTPELLSDIVAVVLSLLFSYVSGFATWFNGLQSDYKRVVMAAMLILAVVIIFILACTGILSGVQCSQKGVLDMISALITALVANQAVDRISPKVGLKSPSRYALVETSGDQNSP